MPTLRRKFLFYPVALAITFLVTTSARAQLCSTAVTTSSVAGLNEPTAIGLFQADERSQTVQLASPEPIAQAPTYAATNFAAALPLKAVVEDPAANAAQNEPVASSRPHDDFVRELVLASSQPAPAEANLQFLFAN